MNKLCKHLYKLASHETPTDVWCSDELLTKMYRLYLYQDSVQAMIEGKKPHDLGTQAFLEWAETLSPCDLDSEFNEHELLELFSDED